VRDPPLEATELRAALAGLVGDLDVVARTGSTNADLLAAAGAGAPDRTVLVAEQQDAGRGRLDRRWTSPPGAGLTFSVLLRASDVPLARWGWLPLLAGLSLVRTIRELTSVHAALKWPNDLLLGPPDAPKKGAGLLAEVAANGASGPAVVLGVGLNVRTEPDELPPGGTSLLAEGADIGRHELLVALLRRLLTDEAAWRAAGGDPDTVGLRADYRRVCATLGEQVRIELPGGGVAVATALDVDEEGRLLVRDCLPEGSFDDVAAGLLRGPTGTRAIAAGDVVHLRPLP
jgi:BirA family biotin operon repressor/biotin-[acetyl-CoA-carboxylase] ligase